MSPLFQCRLRPLLLLTACTAGAAWGQTAPAPAAAPMAVVQVDGLADPDTQSYRRMRKGMDAFEQHHALAPAAALRYRLYPRLPGVRADGVRLRLQGGTRSLPIALDPDLGFTLPRDAQALDDGADVVSNRKARSFAWAPEVITPGLPPNTRRLGDLRLECQIDRAASLLVGLKTPAYYVIEATIDVCSTFPGAWLYYAERAVFNVTMVHGQRRQVLLSPYLYGSQAPVAIQIFYDFYPFLIDRTYHLKISDSSWPDDTLIELEYMDDAVLSAAVAP
ncbi:hypothetical protein [Massilia sp. DWR3-1-1]|uniref:hypothetical protein n=1 Tax=Massilia sp. DWR3-1-1 TaxID=2804559 RepID=UPI003CF7C8BF